MTAASFSSPKFHSPLLKHVLLHPTVEPEPTHDDTEATLASQRAVLHLSRSMTPDLHGMNDEREDVPEGVLDRNSPIARSASSTSTATGTSPLASQHLIKQWQSQQS